MAIAGLVGQLRSLDDNGDPQAPAQLLAARAVGLGVNGPSFTYCRWIF